MAIKNDAFNNDRMEQKIRELQVSDIPLLLDYWYNSDAAFLRGIGADKNKLPSRNDFNRMLKSQIDTALKDKKSYALIWELDGRAIGHTNVNKLVFGKHAFMHLHLWKNPNRKKGLGSVFVKESLPFYFENLKLQKLFCEPYALNPAPNKTLKKVGFRFQKRYKTNPGSINFLQEVNRWSMTKKQFLEL